MGGVGAAAPLVLVALLLASTASAAPVTVVAPPRPTPPVGAIEGSPAAEEAAALRRELARDAKDPRALVPILELSALEGEVEDPETIATAYRRVAQDRSAHPDVRALARLRLASLHRALGRLEPSRTELAGLGFLGGWWVVGPFDNGGKAGFDEAFPPERPGAYDASARFPGKVREVSWRPLPPEATNAGFVDVGTAVRPTREVVVYARTLLHASARRTVRLRLGASGAVKVFLDGSLVHADRADHPARFDQASIALSLRPGVNELVLKLCHVEGRLGFYARIEERPGPAEDALVVLQRRARAAKGAGAAQAQYDLAAVLAERRPDDRSDLRPLDEARRAVELAPRSVRARLLAARLEQDPNRRRTHLEAARDADPRNVRVLVALAADEQRRGQSVEARRLLDAARAIAPRDVPTRLALARVWEGAGLAERARAEREALAAEFPWHAGALAAAARAARRGDDAIALYRRALARKLDDAAVRAALVQLLVDRARIAEAITLLEETRALAPADVDLRMQLGELEAANGRVAEAEREFAEALRIAPDEAELFERRGQARLRGGRTDDAVADFTAALALRPQNPQLKELLRALEPARGRFEQPYLLDLRQEARVAPATPPDADAVVLGEVQVTRVFPSGLAARFRQLVVKVATPRGVEAWRSWSSGYAPGRQELRVDRARILKPDGTIVEAHEESDRSVSEPWYRLYYDQRARELRFPALAPGDVLEIAVRTDDVAQESLVADSFGEQVFLTDATPKHRFEYVLLVPEGRRIYVAEPATTGVAHATRALPDGLVEHRWTARDLPRLRPEPAMPGWSEVAPYVHVSTFASWDELGRAWWALVRDQVSPTRAVRDLAAQLAATARAERRAAGAPPEGDELAVIQAVQRFVVTNTRYVGLEFGIHGYKPYRVDQVLDRRFGDCKDKAGLTHALLEALGIDSRLVLLRMRRLGPVAERPASLAVFNHAVLYVPRHDLWLDGTASYAGTRDLPAEDRGASVLVVEPNGGSRLTAVPEGPAEANLTVSTYDVTLAPDGGATIRGALRVTGMHAPTWRRAYAADAERQQQLEQAMARVFPGATVQDVRVSDLGRLEDAVDVRFTLAHGSVAERDGDGFVLLPFGAPHRYADRAAALSSREHDLVLGPPTETRFTYRYVLPKGMTPVSLPADLALASPHGRIEVAFRSEPGVLVASARVVFAASRVPVQDYPAFRDLLRRLDHALGQRVRLRLARGGAS